MQNPEEEDADELKLGSKFNEADCLLNAEVALILDNKLTNDAESEQDSAKQEMIRKFKNYVDRFNHYGGPNARENAKSVRELLEESEEADLEKFEVAAIANLHPSDEEEAKSLVRSLRGIDQRRPEIADDVLKVKLNELSTFRSYDA